MCSMVSVSVSYLELLAKWTCSIFLSPLIAVHNFALEMMVNNGESKRVITNKQISTQSNMRTTKKHIKDADALIAVGNLTIST